jgi:putative oxygen-independent coproporphyrinogen III oxidase
MNTGIYIHIPFCRKKCSYCSFYSITLNDGGDKGSMVQSYLWSLEKDIVTRLADRELTGVDTIYFGGGTPSILEGHQVRRIIEILKENSRVAETAEISLELNPEDAQPERLKSYTEAGVNRIILGYQTSVDRLHSFIGRSSKPCTVDDLDIFFDAEGFSHCIDVITGIPGQTTEDLTSELDLVTACKPDHISVYQLSIEEGTPLKERYSPSRGFGDHQRNIMEQTIGLIKGKGYEHYEISNFALNGSYSRHNLKYWTWQPYLGFGPGAHSFFNDERYSVSMTVNQYLHSPEIRLSIDERGPHAGTVEYIMTGLRLMGGISIPAMEKTLGVSLPESVMKSLENQERGDNISITSEGGDTTISLTDKGLYVANSVIYEIIESLLQP